MIEQNEIDFEFDRPTRFLDLEGGAPILADPTLIANQYRRAMDKYLEDIRIVMRDSVVDYRQVRIDESYDNVLAHFLLSRLPKGAK